MGNDHSQCCFDCQYCKQGDTSNCPVVLGQINQLDECVFCDERRELEESDESLQDISKLRQALKDISIKCDGSCGEIAREALKV
jgi:hypothetical protein